MPAQAPSAVDPRIQDDLKTLGERLRSRRQAMRIAADSVARAANMSRQSLHRIEHGEPSVTMGAYLNVLRALGLELQVVDSGPAQAAVAASDLVHLDDFPQLKRVAWHRQGEVLTEKEALGLYERNWRHIDRSSLEPAERKFMARLVKRHGQGVLLV